MRTSTDTTMIDNNARLKVGVIGAGRIARQLHVPSVTRLKPLYEFVGVSDLNPDAAGQLCKDLGAGKPYGSLAAMKEANPDLDLVVIATFPFSTHAPLAIEALEAGCHVLVEKPFATSLDEARRMFAAADRCGRKIIAFQNRRFEVSFLAFKQALDEGVVGTPRLLRRRITCSMKPDLLMNMGSHLVDQLICLTGGVRPTEVSAIMQDPSTPYDGSAGYFKAALRYPGGLVAEAEMLPSGQYVGYAYAVGERGSFRVDWADNMADLFRKNWALDCPDKTWLPSDFGKRFPDIFTNNGSLYHVYYEQLHAHLASGAPAPVSRDDTLLQFAIVEEMFRSAREGRTVALDPR